MKLLSPTSLNPQETPLVKKADRLPISARLAASILGAGSAYAYQSDQRRLALQARAMNDQFRLLLALRMGQATSNMEHTRVPVLLPSDNGMPLGLTEGMVRMASAIGQDLAQEDVELEKDAGIGAVVGNTLKGLGGLIPGMAKSVNPLATTVGGATRASVQRGMQALPRTVGTSRAGGFAPPTRAELLPTVQQRRPVAPPAAQRNTQAATVRTPMNPPAAQQASSSSSRSTQQATVKSPAPAAPLPATPQAPPQRSVPAPMPPAPMPAATPAQPQAPSILQRVDREFNNGQWKWKLPAMGAMALGAYGVHRAGKGVFNYLGREGAPPVFNEGGATAANGVNQYGVPDRATSFTY